MLADSGDCPVVVRAAASGLWSAVVAAVSAAAALSAAVAGNSAVVPMVVVAVEVAGMSWTR